MKIEPCLDTGALAAAVQREYGVEVEELTFLPAGWAAYNYEVRGTNGQLVFLKLYDAAALDMTVANDPRFYLPLAYQLCTKGLLPDIPCPILTRDGCLSTHFDAYQVQLWTFVEGEVVGLDGVSDAILGELARLVGILHHSLPQLELECPLREDFRISFERNLLDDLRALDTIEGHYRSGLRALQELLLPRRQELLALLEALHELQECVRVDERPFVVCHTDLHGQNLMRDAAGRLFILDWETAMIAPPEHDLFFWAAEDRFWNLFLPIYEREAGPAHLERDTFGFYFYRRNLEDVAGFVQTLLHTNTSDEQDAGDLHWLAECVAEWPKLEGTITTIGERLSSRKVATGVLAEKIC